jgi:hypothetical protein
MSDLVIPHGVRDLVRPYWGMHYKTWLIEVEVAGCILAGAIVAFGLMVGHSLWKNLVHK